MSLATRIAALEAMKAVEKRAAWRETFRTPAPPALGSGLLARAIAYRWQEKMEGGSLSREELRQLASLAGKDAKLRSGAIVAPIKPDTWLSRCWHGEVHEVVVLGKGYDYRGEHFASLSSIARRITGANWSGPRFFGLYSPRMGQLRVVSDGR